MNRAVTGSPRRQGRRAEVTAEILGLDTLVGPDYAGAWDVVIGAGDGRTAEQWARAIFEGAPSAVRALIVAGWKGGLGLRLGPRPSPGHVLGWHIATAAPDLIILEVQFRFGTAHNVVRVGPTQVLVATFVRSEKRGGRLVWSIAAPLHHRIVPYLLGGAASRRVVR